MIRREGTACEATEGSWVLISQVDHAQLSGRLAEHWGAGGFASLVPRDEVLEAIYHHDDGWQAWEQAPQVDHSSGVPRSFTEMELAASLEIWTGSIDAALRAGPLPGALVAGHFLAIARRSAPWRKHDPRWPRAEEFLTRYDQESACWLAAWQAENPTSNTPAAARQALAQLQFFDALSLWFCCHAAVEPESTASPGGPDLRLVPVTPRRVQLAPWPLELPSLDVEIAGRAVPVGFYRDAAELARAPSRPLRLAWHLESAP